MAKTTYGFSSAVGGSTSPNNAQNQSPISFGRVIGVFLDPTQTDSQRIGYIEYVDVSEVPRDVSTVQNNQQKKQARPLFPNIKDYPLVNEIVMLINGPDMGIGSTTASRSVYYISGVNIWNHPHHNAIPFSEGTAPPSQIKSYSQVELGSPRKLTNKPTEIYFGATFRERANINPLQPFEGDVIYEGRWGNSIRLGSTVKNRPNTWSSTGTDGDPIFIIRNGQGITPSNGWSHVVEDINYDKSSIYLTSTQKIPLAAASSTYASYSNTTAPTSPSEYTGNQILLSSGRLVFNSSKDHLLFSSAKSINLNAVEGINIDTSKNVTIQSNKIYLGSYKADQPLVLGNRLESLLNQLIDNLQGFAQICATTIAPDGTLAPINTAATQLTSTLVSLKSTVPNIKSKYNYTV